MKSSIRLQVLVGLAVTWFAALCGCQANNPSFDLSVGDAKASLREMRDEPKPLRRPLVILAGWGDPGFADAHLFERLSLVLDDERILRLDFGGTETFEQCRTLLIQTIDRNLPSRDPDWTTEVDVVANSMGGLIARYASLPIEGRRTLRIGTLFAIASPFQGADTANLPIDTPIVLDMRPDSEFLEQLNARPDLFDYELVPYARLGDTWVGLARTAPPGEHPWWVPNQFLQPAHLFAFMDPRFIADIARRLREEEPYTTLPRTPPP